MKKRLFIVLLCCFISIFVLSNCEHNITDDTETELDDETTDDKEEETDDQAGDDTGGGTETGGEEDNDPDRTFWAVDSSIDYTTNSAGWYQVEADLVKEGTNCQVYLERNQNVAQSTIDDIAADFDSAIWNVINNNFSSPTDIDSNGKVILLLLDIQDNYNPPSNTVYTGGYFFGIDLFTNTELQNMGYPTYYKSNEAEILYIDVNPNDPTSLNCKSTVTHEFQHLACFSQNVIRENSSNLPTWINEGFSTAAEAIYQNVDILASRENWYDADPLFTGNGGVPTDVGKSISYGYPLVLWDIYPSNDYAVLNNYSLSHLFFSWLRIHMGNDTFFKDIHNSSNNSIQAVITTASNTIGSDVDTFQKMLSKWWMANALGGNGKTSGLESYNGLNSHYGPYMFSEAGSSIGLYASGAVHFMNTAYNNWSPSGVDSQIGYQMGNLNTGTADYVEPFGTGDDTNELMIVYNSDDSGTTAGTSAVLPIIFPTLSGSASVNVEGTKSVRKASGQSAPSSTLPPNALQKGLEPKGPELPELNPLR